jgi:hypothetical protein
VRLQRRTRGPQGRWRTFRRRTVAAEDDLRTRYSFRVTRERRSRRYRVVVRPDDGGRHVSGKSRSVRVKPRRR